MNRHRGVEIALGCARSLSGMARSCAISPAPGPSTCAPSTTVRIGIDDELHQHAVGAAGERALQRAEGGLVDVEVLIAFARGRLRSIPPCRSPAARRPPSRPGRDRAWSAGRWKTVSTKHIASWIATGVELEPVRARRRWPRCGRRWSANIRRPGSRPSCSSSIADRLQPETFDVRVAGRRRASTASASSPRRSHRWARSPPSAALLDLLEDFAAEDTHALVASPRHGTAGAGPCRSGRAPRGRDRRSWCRRRGRRRCRRTRRRYSRRRRSGSSSGSRSRWNASLEVMQSSCPSSAACGLGPPARGDQDVLGGDGAPDALKRIRCPPASTARSRRAPRRLCRDWRGRRPPSRAISLSLLAISVGQSNSRRSDAPAVGGAILELLAELRRVDKQLLGHAAADHAGASHPVGFRDGDPRAGLCGLPGGADAARTRRL